MIYLLLLLLIAAGFLYQYFDELQDRSVNSDWTKDDFYTRFFSIAFLNKRPEGWKRKWKNNDPAQGPAFWQSDELLVFLTDGEHFFQFLKQLVLINMIGAVMGYCSSSLLVGAICAATFALGLLIQGFSKRYTQLR